VSELANSSLANSSLAGSETRDLGPALYRAAVALGQTRDASEVVRVAITETQRAAHLEAVALYVLDPERQVLVLKDAAGTSMEFRERTSLVRVHDAGPVARAIQGQEITTIPVAEQPAAELRAAFAEHGFHYVTVAPVTGRHQTLGVLYLASRELQPLSPKESALVQAIAGLVGVALENATLWEQLLAHQERLRALAGGVLRAREAEARRIAHELHDEASQILAGLHITLDTLVRDLPAPPEALGRLHAELDRVEAQLRRLSHELRPAMLDDLGLAAALEWLGQGVTDRAGVAVAVQAPEDRLTPEIETALYRIIQEALTNAVRHGRPRRIAVEVHEESSHIRAVVRDDGHGFDVPAAWARRGDRGLGLIGMRERAEALGGTLEIRSTPGQGTELSVRIPREAGR
jgi:signal transduction histidine kinase